MIKGISLILACAGLFSTVARAQISDDVVKIGVLEDMSGLYADFGGAGTVLAAKMAIEDFGGTVNGKPIELVFADHQNKPDVGTAIVRRWIENEDVDAVAGIPTSSVALAVSALVRDKKRILLTTGGSSDLTGKACSPYTTQWGFDTYALAAVTGSALVAQGSDSWFFITVDYAFGQSLERDTTHFVEAGGGKVLGTVKHPLNTADFSSYLLTAQHSGAKVIGLANGGPDLVNTIKQAGEYGIQTHGQKLAALLLFITDIHALGLKAAQGILLTTSSYWDMDEGSRSFGKRFMANNKGQAPSQSQAVVYSAVSHYLKSIKIAGTDDATSVATTMRATHVNDFMSKNVLIPVNGRVMRDMFLMEVKKPEESKYPWDYYTLRATIPPEKAFRSLVESGCPLAADAN